MIKSTLIRQLNIRGILQQKQNMSFFIDSVLTNKP